MVLSWCCCCCCCCHRTGFTYFYLFSYFLASRLVFGSTCLNEIYFLEGKKREKERRRVNGWKEGHIFPIFFGYFPHSCEYSVWERTGFFAEMCNLPISLRKGRKLRAFFLFVCLLSRPLWEIINEITLEKIYLKCQFDLLNTLKTARQRWDGYYYYASTM